MNNFFEGKDFGNSKFKALMPEFYPAKYQKYIEEESELVKERVAGAKKVLEAGVGIGRTIPIVAPLVEEMVGIDIAELMLEESKRIAERYDNVIIKNLAIEDLHRIYGEDYFDHTLCLWNTVGNLEDEVVALRAMSRVTKGSIMITVYQKGTLGDRKNWYKSVGIPIRRVDEKNEIFYSESGLKSKSYSLKDIEDIAEKSGLKIVESKILGEVILWVELSKDKK